MIHLVEMPLGDNEEGTIVIEEVSGRDTYSIESSERTGDRKPGPKLARARSKKISSAEKSVDMEESPVSLQVEDTIESTFVLKTITEKMNFQGIFEKIKPAVKIITNTLKDINHPSEIGVEFGVNFKSGFGGFITTPGPEANFKVTLKWKNDD